VVLSNDRVVVVFRRGGPGAELYGTGIGRPVLRAVLAPLAAAKRTRLGPITLIENSGNQSVLDASFTSPDGKQAVVRFELGAGQAFVKTAARYGARRLRLEAPCRFAVLPDCFADDIVVDAAELPGARTWLPSENFFLHMIDGGEAIVMAVWSQRGEDVAVAPVERGGARVIEASEIAYGIQGAIYVAVLESPGIWHRHDVTKAEGGQVVRLGWEPPFPAQWRLNFRRDNGLADSWDMLVENPDGSFAKPSPSGLEDDDGIPAWLKSGRQRWTPALGQFSYPCWIDQEGRGCLQPFVRPYRFLGAALAYPLDREPATPLGALTFVDIMRASLGVGPCEYVLDVEGQKKEKRGVPTCVTRRRLLAIYSRNEQNQKRAEVEEALDNVLAFVQHIRARIEAYVSFGSELAGYLDREKKSRPELAGFITEMAAIARSIDVTVAGHRRAMQTPQYAAGLVEDFRTTLLDREGDDALERCTAITGALVEIGDHQDKLVAECREAVKLLRQR
jgi:hypothetical protein